MAVNLHRHKFIFLEKSTVNWDKSDPSQGDYHFEGGHKVYTNYQNSESRPEHWLSWERYDENDGYRDFKYKKMTGYAPVSVEDKLYWPEHVWPNENGHYVVGDVILMQRSLLDYVQEKEAEEKRSKGGGRAVIEKFEGELGDAGALPESMRNR